MFEAYGLHSHIRNNRIKTVLLLAGFVLLLQALLFSLLLIVNAFANPTFETIVAAALDHFTQAWPLAMLAAAIWFAVAYAFHGYFISRATGAHNVTRKEAPHLYNSLENLCISRGIPMPELQIIETPALNAYAAGLKEGQYRIAVTRGLIERLNDQEIEAVLGHELTHIRNKDTQLMVVAIIFAGIFGFFADMIIRRWDFPYGLSPRSPRRLPQPGPWQGRHGDNSSHGSGRGGNAAGALLAIALAIAIILISWGISTLIRFALSRSREYLADAGAVELTKNPDAMISALRKIDDNATFDVQSRMEAFFIENPLKQRMAGFLATHPSIEDRVAALKKYANGRDLADA